MKPKKKYKSNRKPPRPATSRGIFSFFAAGRKEGKMGKGYFWVFFGDKNEVHYLFSPSREGRVLKDALSMFQGTLVSDGYAAYESFATANPGVLLVQCWTHTRREFLNAEKKIPKELSGFSGK
jgi:transposase IS66 family protein